MLLVGFEGAEVALLVGKRRRGREALPELFWLARGRLFPEDNRKKIPIILWCQDRGLRHGRFVAGNYFVLTSVIS